ncbi:cob(I)yrinic acid a,c-diamide adenosyltransferase [Bacteroides propionicifaciens]|uniref:cob(I)yrinic acid a,c-diamide adenosyltransferase n=1 Tax=Bacteroides propionicifaciens TaxID=392838 RepID=UPI00036DD6F9|nr:cob(I)yrinic acid a,c-diamide adenosyltransferase [Bacteroides propionicifaciens]
MDNKGYLQVYTGDGKGKTTAAFGLALRALCAGKKVYIGQFVKSMKYNETKIDQYFDTIKIEQLGRGCFIKEDPEQIDIDMAKQGLVHCAELMTQGSYDVVILDEVTIALYYKLFTVEELIEAIQNRKPSVEVIVTGRYAPDELLSIADLVTEMKEIKHYYSQGVLSRNGIDK